MADIKVVSGMFILGTLSDMVSASPIWWIAAGLLAVVVLYWRYLWAQKWLIGVLAAYAFGVIIFNLTTPPKPFLNFIFAVSPILLLEIARYNNRYKWSSPDGKR